MPIYKLKQSLKLEKGGYLDSVQIEYEISGNPKNDGSNVIIICHNLTGGLNVVESPLWSFIGNKKTIDSNQYCIICLGTLGGLNESTGPRSLNKKGNPYGPEFPTVTVTDSIHAHIQVLNSLGIKKAKAIIGGSYGGFCVYTWLALKPQFYQIAVVFQSSLWCSAHTIAIFSLCRDLITSSPSWRNGKYTNKDLEESHSYTQMIAVNRLFQMSHYKFEKKFPRTSYNNSKKESVGYWEKYSAIDDFITERSKIMIDPNTLLSTFRSSSLFDLEKSFPQLWETWKELTTTVIQVPCIQDWRYPAEEMHKIHNRLKGVGIKTFYRPTQSELGHGSYLYDPESINKVMKLLKTQLIESQ